MAEKLSNVFKRSKSCGNQRTTISVEKDWWKKKRDKPLICPA